jgi:hypothetical protein
MMKIFKKKFQKIPNKQSPKGADVTLLSIWTPMVYRSKEWT